LLLKHHFLAPLSGLWLVGTTKVYPGIGIRQTVQPALLVAISYYVGTRIGLAWTPSGRPNSIFWPANAILLAAFLFSGALVSEDEPSK
jgi:hypothetical protein